MQKPLLLHSPLCTQRPLSGGMHEQGLMTIYHRVHNDPATLSHCGALCKSFSHHRRQLVRVDGWDVF